MSNITVTKEQIDMLLEEADIQTETRFDKCTIVTVRLKNGFILTASSACVDPENYDEELGKSICLEQIKDRLWELEGYVLQKEVYEDLRVMNGMDFGKAIEAARRGEKIAREGWNGKGMWVVYRTGYPGGIRCNKNTADAIGVPEGELVRIRPYLQMRCADGSFQMWLASQSDILARDWYVAE